VLEVLMCVGSNVCRIPYNVSFPVTLGDLEGHFSCFKPLWIQYHGNVSFGCFSAISVGL